MGVGYVCHIKDGTINAYDEFTNYERLTIEEKTKKLNENDEIVAKSFSKILENIMYNNSKEKI